MRTRSAMLIALLLILGCSSSEQPGQSDGPSGPERTEYYFGLIERAENWTAEPTEDVAKLQEAHLANIRRLADEGLMALAGPFWREEIPAPSGLFIYDVSSQSAADSLASTDPAVMANRLKVTNYLFETDGPINYDIPVEMVTYVSCFYRVGPNFDTTMPIVTEELVVHQTEQIRSVSENGRLVMAGSFGPNEANPILHSFLVFAADSLSQVERAVENAPGVKSEQLVTDVMYWYGPAGLKAEPATKEPNDSLSN